MSQRHTSCAPTPSRIKRHGLCMGRILCMLLFFFPVIIVAVSRPGQEYPRGSSFNLGLIDDNANDGASAGLGAGGVDFLGGLSTGTTMVAAKYKDGVVVGADSRSVKNGRYVADRFTDKVQQVSEYVVLVCSGRTAVVQRLNQEIAARLRFYQIQHQRLPTSRHAAAVLRILMRMGLEPVEEKQQRNDKTQVTMDTDALAAGWSPREGPRIHQVLTGGTVLEARDYAVAGHGADYIVGFMDAHYPQAEEAGKALAHAGMSKEDCEEIVRRAMALAVGRDTQSGEGVTIAVVNPQGTTKRVLSSAELQRSLKKALSVVKATENRKEKEREGATP